MPENQYRGISNATDIYGNTGFRQWLKVPNTSTYYFMSDDMNTHGTKDSVGFLAGGWFNFGWAGQDTSIQTIDGQVYRFDDKGVLKQ